MTTDALGGAPPLGDTRTLVTAANAEERHVLLTENGRTAARALAPLAAKTSFALVLTSPLHRARETGALAGLGAQTEVDSNLHEWNYGDYEGLTPKEIHARDPDWMLFTDGCPPHVASVGPGVGFGVAPARVHVAHEPRERRGAWGPRKRPCQAVRGTKVPR
jgi:broad specificity phosphatase PhoE